MTRTNTRSLTQREIALFPTDFTSRIDIHAVSLINHAHNPFARGKILVRGTRIYWPKTPRDFTQETVALQAILMHELCHVWQYSTGRLTALKYLCNPLNWIYTYALEDAVTFHDYPIEKQADLMQDWYRLNKGSPAVRCTVGRAVPLCEDLNRVIPFAWDSPDISQSSRLPQV